MSSKEGYLSYPADGLLTEGMDPVSADFKRLRLMERALNDLDPVDKLRFDFVVSEKKRHVIKGELEGSSMVDNKRIKVTYRPNIKANFIELLEELEFGGISFE